MGGGAGWEESLEEWVGQCQGSGRVLWVRELPDQIWLFMPPPSEGEQGQLSGEGFGPSGGGGGEQPWPDAALLCRGPAFGPATVPLWLSVSPSFK